MLVIFLILISKLTYNNIVNAQSEENKYIDLLPDEEKRQFIENVARKIIKDVESKEEKPKGSIELSAEQLNEHNDYVKELVKEETDNIRRSKDQINSTNSSDESVLAVKPLEKKNHPEKQDLTLRTGKEVSSEEIDINIEIITDEAPKIKKSIRNKTDNENENNTEDPYTKSTTDHPNKGDLDNSSNTSSVEVETTATTTNNETTTVKLNKESVESISTIDNTTVKADIDIKPLNISRLTRRSGGDDINIESKTVVPVDDDDKSSEPSNEDISIPLINKTTVVSTTTVQDSWSASNEDEDEDKVEITTNTITSTLSDEGTTNLVIETTSYKPPSTTNSPKILTEPTTVKDEIEVTLKHVIEKPIKIKRKSSNKDIETSANFNNPTKIAAIPLKLLQTTISAIDASVFKPASNAIIAKESIEGKVIDDIGIKIEKTLDEVEDKAKEAIETITNSIATTTAAPEPTTTTNRPDALTKAPQEILLAEITLESSVKDNKNFIEVEKVLYNSTPVTKQRKIYEVYEIPPGVPAFVKKAPVMLKSAKAAKPVKLRSSPVAEEPYYVPIYNYSPQNAYYNPQNRLGPNANDNSTEIVELKSESEESSQSMEELNLDVLQETEYTDSGFDIDRKFKNAANPYGYQRPIRNNLITKKRNRGRDTNDIPDSGYFFGRKQNEYDRRNNEEFVPNSDEAQHPVHSIQEMNLKDHIRAVRNILYTQGNFGEFHPSTYFVKEEPKKAQGLRSENTQRFTATNQHDDDNKVKVETLTNVKEVKEKSARTERKGKDKLVKIGTIGNSKGIYIIEDEFKKKILDYFRSEPEVSKNNADVADLEDLIEEEERKKNKKIRDNSNEEPERSRSVKKTKHGKEHLNIDKKRLKELNLKLKLQRRNDDVKIGVYLEVLKDLVSTDSRALEKYDWLATTVDVQASLQKLFELITQVHQEERVHPADMEILRYVVFLHKLALQIIEANDIGSKLRKIPLPKGRKKRVERFIKEKGLVHKVWTYLRKRAKNDDDEALDNFNKFLMDVEDSLYDLHDAIKNIAKITKYKNQHWYENLKDLYLNTEEKSLLEVLLHLSVYRLVSLIEDSATKGLEDNYILYMKKNKEVAKKTLEEMIFAMQIIHEINKNV